MIVKMKKVYALAQQKDVESIVSQLGVLGVVHLEPQRPLVNDTIILARERVQSLEQSLLALTIMANEHKLHSVQKEFFEDNWQDLVGEIMRAYDEINQLQLQIIKREAEINIWKLWGNFEPGDIQFLREQGFIVQLWEGLRFDLAELPSDVVVHTISEKGKFVRFATVANKSLDLPLTAVAFPEMSLENMRLLQQQDQNALMRYRESLQDKECYRNVLNKILIEQKAVLDFEEVLQGRGEREGVVYLKGYCPVDECAALEQAARDKGWFLLAQEPTENDVVPTAIRNSRWIGIIHPIFDIMNIVPGYHEKDISPFFLVFFAIFCSILIGDAGYGAIFFIATFFAHKVYGGKIADKAIFYLAYLLSIATMIWGLLTGTIFGTMLFGETVKPLLPWLSEARNVQLLCFTLGVIHLTFAHIWRAVTRQAIMGSLAEVGWILVLWGSYFLANMMLLGMALPWFVAYLYLAGGAMVVADIVAQRKDIGVNMMLLVFSVINTFGDVVSYIRLFAVGLASVAVADAFNQIALTIGFNNIFLGVSAVLILIFVHLFLNLVLCLMAILVHGVRLNILEFSSHLGMEWSGIKYSPYKITAGSIKT